MVTHGGDAVWWRDGVLYQIYPRSFADSDGDGVGDLRGIVDRLDHLAWLGIDAVWINPVTPSPNRDWGYDVSDYTGVHPELGTLEDIDLLVSEAKRRGIAVVLDIVPNHTSDQHPWFVEARRSRDSRFRDYYVWADPRADGSPPNNWISVFGGEPAWEFDEVSGQYYLHNFLAAQPDLNWWNTDVRNEFDRILRFWFDRGIAGFRIDVAHALVKDQELRDNLPATDDDHESVRSLGQRAEHNMNRPEVHEVFRRWRRLCDSYDPPRVLIGETFVMDLEMMAHYYGSGRDELHLAFNFPFALASFDARALSEIIGATDTLIPPEGWPVYMASNHDVGRFTTRWCAGDERKIRCALVALLTLRGTPFLYYGDEIGMLEPDIPPERMRDPIALRGGPGRDACRTPMQWSAQPGAGFTTAQAIPWLPLGDHEACNVAAQREDPSSVLSLCRELISLRKRTPELRRGAYRLLSDHPGQWAWARGDNYAVALNTSEESCSLGGIEGEIVLSTLAGDRAASGRKELDPWEGVIVRR